jgi:hypothetical protein
MYRPQQLDILTEMMQAMEDRQITTLEMQNILNTALSFGMSTLFMTALGALVRWFVIEALEESEEKRVLPVIEMALPETRRVTVSAGEIFSRAKDYFGTTTNPDEAGYILPDGAMLDFSGRRFGGTSGERLLDHRDIAFAWPEEEAVGGFEAMQQVMNWGAIRFSVFRDMVIVNLVKPPTDAQIRRINLVLDYYPEAVLIVQVDNSDLYQIAYREFTYPFAGWEDFVDRAAERKSQWHLRYVGECLR